MPRYNPAEIERGRTLESDKKLDLLIVHIAGDKDGQQKAIEAVERCRANCPKLPIVALFDKSDSEARLRLYRVDVRHMLTRPIDYGRLRRLADSLTVRSRLELAESREGKSRAVAPPLDTHSE